MRDDLAARLKDLLSEELGLYRTLRAMVSRELEAILLNEDMEELLDILQEKDAVIFRLQLLVDSWQDALSDLGLQGTRGADGVWEQLLASLPEAHSGELSQALQETRAIAEELSKAEASAQEELERYLSGLREKLASMTRGREAVIGYTKMGGSTFVS